MKEKLLDILSEICEDEIVKEDMNVELFKSGLIDSLSFAELLVAIEDELGVVISPSEIERDDVNTPEKLWNAVSQRAER